MTSPAPASPSGTGLVGCGCLTSPLAGFACHAAADAGKILLWLRDGGGLGPRCGLTPVECAAAVTLLSHVR